MAVPQWRADEAIVQRLKRDLLDLLEAQVGKLEASASMHYSRRKFDSSRDRKNWGHRADRCPACDGLQLGQGHPRCE
jgi:hypothetical protein